MESRVLLGVFAFVFCLIWGSTAGWTGPGWSVETPENCPHRNNETNTCSSVVRWDINYCLSIRCCDGEEDEDSSSEADESSSSENTCEHGLCVHIASCTLYTCKTRCCDGYERDAYSGSCRNSTGELECQNGGTLIRRRRRYHITYECKCPEGFTGRSCEIPICHCMNMGECTVANGRPHCECLPGFHGTHCENATCDLACENAGTCMSDGQQQVCKCPHGYVGDLCQDKYANSALCPVRDLYRGHGMESIRIECSSDDECYGDKLCCNEGSNLVCRKPATTDCVDEGGNHHSVGDRWKPDVCTTCYCLPGGHECAMMSCAYPTCADGIEPITDDPAQCCPYCPDVCTDDDGNQYSVGERWQLDSCTSCQCKDNGEPECVSVMCGMPRCTIDQIMVTDDPTSCCPYCKEKSCEYKGKTYPNGAGFPDDCNRCTCIEGTVACTLVECPTTEEPSTCVHEGVVYAEGISFKDDCNTCTCTGGHVSCTEMACPPVDCVTDAGDTYSDGETFDIECNTCTCLAGHVACTEMTCVTSGPTCTYNGTTYGPGISFAIDCNTCFCTNGNIACTKKACPCDTLGCQNNGKCYTTKGIPQCKCPSMYAGRLCETRYDHPDNCPKPKAWTESATAYCSAECKNSSDCGDGGVCCKEGCHLLCRQPTTVVCHYNGMVFQPGDTYSSNPCEECRCDNTGNMACALMDCARPRCPYGILPVKRPDKCCPECPSSSGPKIECPQNKVEIIAAATDAELIVLTEKITMIKAMDSKGQPARVRFEPQYAEHCQCYDSDKAVKWAVASVTDNGITEQCRFAYIVKDVTSPAFRSCPEDMYVFDDEAITYKKPTYQDNVAIAGERCDMDPEPMFYSPGTYAFKYSIWDFDRNSAVCRFRLSVSERDTAFGDLPQGLKDRSTSSPRVAVIVGPVAGVLAIIIAVVIAALCCRFRRAKAHSAASSVSGSRGPGPAYDNNIYAVPADVSSIHDYHTLPPNPPAYHSDNMSIKSNYTFIPPPAYKEVAELKAPSSYANPDYVSIGSGTVKSDNASSKNSVKM